MSEKPAYEEWNKAVIGRKLTEDKLGESEERYRTLFETMAQGVVYQDAEGKIISANPSAEKILGLSLSQMQGRTSIDPRWKSIHEDGSDFPGETHPSMVALNTGEEVNDVIMGVFNPQTEAYRWININAVPQFKEGEDSAYQAYTTFDDITEHKEAEEALIKSETFLSATGQIAKVGGWEIDGETKNVFWTKEIYNITEVPPEYDPSSLEKEAIVFFNEEDQLRLEKAIQRAFEHSEPYNMEFLITTAKENKKWVQAICEPIVADGKVVRLSGIFQDISERKQAEEALRESEIKYRTLIENANEAIVVAQDGIFIFTNPKGEELFGYSQDELASKPFIHLFYEEEREMIRERHQKRLHGEDFTHTYPVRIVNKSGKIKWVELNAILFSWEERPAVLCFMTDINERKQAEEALRESESKLRQAQKMEAIGTLAGGIAHEFNNILGIIIGNTELAIDDVPEWNPAKECLKEDLSGFPNTNLTNNYYQLKNTSRKSIRARMGPY